jgi:hypothetical protein
MFYVREPMAFGSFYSPFSGFSLHFPVVVLSFSPARFSSAFPSTAGRKNFVSSKLPIIDFPVKLSREKCTSALWLLKERVDEIEEVLTNNNDCFVS